MHDPESDGQAARPPAPRVGMSEAPAAIRRLITACSRAPVVVGITGPVGAGKSTLAARVSPCVIPTDAYLPDYHTLPEHLRDLPEHADLDLLASHIRDIRTYGVARIPLWSFQSHAREGWREIRLTDDAIVVEGIHALDERVIAHIDIAVYVEASPRTRWSRWEAIESSGDRGWGVEKARTYFDTAAEPTFSARMHDYRSRATLFVVND